MLMSRQHYTDHMKLSCDQYRGFSGPKIVYSGSLSLKDDDAPSSINMGVS